MERTPPSEVRAAHGPSTGASHLSVPSTPSTGSVACSTTCWCFRRRGFDSSSGYVSRGDLQRHQLIRTTPHKLAPAIFSFVTHYQNPTHRSEDQGNDAASSRIHCGKENSIVDESQSPAYRPRSGSVSAMGKCLCSSHFRIISLYGDNENRLLFF